MWEKRSKAMAMIFVVSILMALSVMAITFVSVAMVNVRACDNVFYRSYAVLSAQSGIDHALSILYQCFRTDTWYGNIHPGSNVVSPLWSYGGEDVNGDEERQVLSGEEDVDGDGTLDCPVEMAFAPSFKSGQYEVPSLVGLGYSGKFPAHETGASFVTRVEDLSGRIAIVRPLDLPALNTANDLVESELTGTAKLMFNLVKHLSSGLSASQILKRLHDFNRCIPGIQHFSSHKELQSAVVSSGLPQNIAKYLTVCAWEDRTTIRSLKRTDLMLGQELTEPLKQKSEFLELEPRAPVNMNTAPLPVLIACLLGIESYMVKPGVIQENKKSGKMENSPDQIGSVNIPPDVAEYVARRIVRKRHEKPFTSYKELAVFLSELVNEQPVPKLSSHQASLIWANANPNTNSNKEHPDFPDSFLYPLWSRTGKDNLLLYRIDKTDIMRHTTEFCFYPTGHFKIESLGRIVRESQVVSEEKKSVVVKLFDVYKQSTQLDFLSNMVPEHANVRTYPKIASDPKSLSPELAHDGYISLRPTELADSYKKKATYFTSLLPKPNVLSAEDQYWDGKFVSESKADLKTDVLSKEKNPTDKTTMVCFWYKPDWSINDAYARPHAIMDGNGVTLEGDSTFQVYSRCKELEDFPGENPRWNVFVWDAEYKDFAQPLQLDIVLPGGVARNRCVFFGLFWNARNVGMAFNDVLESKGQEQYRQYFAYKDTEEYTLKTTHYRDEVQPDGTIKKVPDRYTYRTYSSSRAYMGVGNDIKKVDASQFDQLEDRFKDDAIASKKYDDIDNGKMIDIIGNDIGSVNDDIKGGITSGSWKHVDDCVCGENEKRDSCKANFEKLSFWVGIGQDEDSQDDFGPNLSPNGKGFYLGGPIKWLNRYSRNTLENYYKEVKERTDLRNIASGKLPTKSGALPNRQWLTAPSYGTYSNIAVLRVKNPATAVQTIKNIYKQGRYDTNSPVYMGSLQLVSPFQTIERKFHLGGIRWTEYRPQDTEIGGPTCEFKITLYDEDRNPLTEAFTKAENNAVDILYDSVMFYKVEIVVHNEKDKPVAFAPMFDDLTITCSRGHQYLEFE